MTKNYRRRGSWLFVSRAGSQLAANVLWDRQQFHQNMLVGQAIPSSVQYQDALHQVTNYFVAQGQFAMGGQAAGDSMGWTAGAGAVLLPGLYGLLISLAAVPLALTLRKVKLGGAAPMGH